MSYRSSNTSGSQSFRSSGGWAERQDRQSHQQVSTGGWAGRQDSQSPSSQMRFDLHALIRREMLSALLAKKISAARNPGTTSIANAFLLRMSRGGPIRNFLQLERYACQNGMANIAALLLFVFNPRTQTFQEVVHKGMEEDQVYLVIPSCIGKSSRSDPNDVWFANGGVAGSCGSSDKQAWGSGADIDLQKVQRTILAASDIQADLKLVRVPLETFCDAMARVGAIPLQVEMDSQRGSLAESAATSSVPLPVEDEPSASGPQYDGWGNRL